MREAIREGQEQSARLMRHGNVSERVGEHMENQAEFWAEGHEHAIEKAADQESDDLERIYAPVLEMAHKARSAAMDEERQRDEKLRSVRRSAARLELLDVTEEVPAAQEKSSVGVWGAASGVLGAGLVVVGLVRRRSVVNLDEPLLG
jgi:hypothetical protein